MLVIEDTLRWPSNIKIIFSGEYVVYINMVPLSNIFEDVRNFLKKILEMGC